MCPFVLFASVLSLLLLLLELSAAFNVTFSPRSVHQLSEGDVTTVNVTLTRDPREQLLCSRVYNQLDNGVVELVPPTTFDFNQSETEFSFKLKGTFLGFTDIRLRTKLQRNGGAPVEEDSVTSLPVSVVRTNSILNTVFIASVATLVSLNYINMGCALDLEVVKQVLVRPVAPLIGCACQFVVMPLVAYGVGQALFGSDHNLQLGLFTFGCSPGGGASNMWTVLLAGNLNLSITLTFISTAAAMLLMPFWLFTLGSVLFKASISVIPFRNIVLSLVSMVIPLGIGLVIQRYAPRVAAFCKRIIAPASIAMIVYIIIFGTYANLYMFRLMSWRVFVAASMNVWIGFLAGVLLSKAFRLSNEDTIAIAVETGVQNTGIAIVLLGFSMGQPSADLASVVPVTASIMTPIPLLVALVVKKMVECRDRKGSSSSHDSKGRYVPQPEEQKNIMVNSPSDLSSCESNGDRKHGQY